ncbi:hypothetical protein V2I01_03480 [Micromonospora sp. BRA006-A]|nr:hypothetical protein [Micromonospora sp. BRA006-A]
MSEVIHDGCRGSAMNVQHLSWLLLVCSRGQESGTPYPARRRRPAGARRRGARGLTHRAVDAEAGVPTGTTSNYFPSRAALLAGLAERIFDRIAPDPAVLADLGRREPSLALMTDYLRDIVARTTREPGLTRALFELRLEAARRPSCGPRSAACCAGVRRRRRPPHRRRTTGRGVRGGAAALRGRRAPARPAHHLDRRRVRHRSGGLGPRLPSGRRRHRLSLLAVQLTRGGQRNAGADALGRSNG